MKEIHFMLAVLFVNFCAYSQEPIFHMRVHKIDTTATSYYGESIKELSKDNFSNVEKLMNYNPTIPFDGESDYLEVEKAIPRLSQMTVFTVFKTENDTISEAEIWGIHGKETTLGLTTKRAYSSSQESYYTGATPNEAVLHSFLQMNRSKQHRANAKTYISMGLTKTDTTTSYFKGSIAELMIYNTRLRGAARQKIETALAIKYGIGLTNGDNYISSEGEVLWDAESDVVYSNNIAGIGRDDEMELYQKQATNSNDAGFLVISAREKALSNAENTGQISNRNFLIWGDNNLDLTLKETNTQGELALLHCQWLMNATGSTAKTIATQLQIDVSKMFDGIKAKKEYLLVIDRSGEGNFSTANTEYLEPDELTADGTLIFDKIRWDTDGSGKDVFSFTLRKDLVASLESEESLICPDASTLFNYQVEGGIPPYEYSLKNTDGYSKQWNSSEDADTNNQINAVPKGAYTLEVKDYLGTTKIITAVIEEDPLLTLDLGDNKKLAFEEELTLTAAISDPEMVKSYHWSKEDSDFSSSEAAIQVGEKGAYSLTVTTHLGCTYTDTIFIDDSFVKDFRLYPNPSLKGRYNIDVALSEPANIQVSVFNYLGVQLATFSVAATHKITVIRGKQPLKQGVYGIVLTTPHETVSRKLIVE